MEQLDSRQIQLWLAFLDEIEDPRLLAEYRLLLSREELQQQQRFYFERDRHRYLVTRAMVRTVLSKYAQVGPREWRFAINEYGKPSIAAEHVNATGIEFNVSHTDGLVVMGVARERAIGVDVENVRIQRAALEIADRFFAPAEVEALRALPAQDQPQRFFEYWTLKESYIKARGVGLSAALNTTDEFLGDRAEHWQFWKLQFARNRQAAVCAARTEQERLQLSRVRSWLRAGV